MSESERADDCAPLTAEASQVLDVDNVIWSTGFQPGFSWIDLPIFGDQGPVHERGIATGESGLYFVGLTFLFAALSSMIHGVGRDAEFVVKAIQARQDLKQSKAVDLRQRYQTDTPAIHNGRN